VFNNSDSIFLIFCHPDGGLFCTSFNRLWLYSNCLLLYSNILIFFIVFDFIGMPLTFLKFPLNYKLPLAFFILFSARGLILFPRAQSNMAANACATCPKFTQRSGVNFGLRLLNKAAPRQRKQHPSPVIDLSLQ
jgi:hypothetical protein